MLRGDSVDVEEVFEEGLLLVFVEFPGGLVGVEGLEVVHVRRCVSFFGGLRFLGWVRGFFLGRK